MSKGTMNNNKHISLISLPSTTPFLRNLIYTGITRAKKICIIVGNTMALAYSIHNMDVEKRNTRLKERFTQ